ncbi:hypothetical protein AAFN85_29850 [Mucilaginibacter sp. CAU 1740]|uniref:hypothetical protein n=1 Tax=Mucilaginibacter sp. CAU 1740 TaxID=3140365 RepID=UPI00325ACA20
MESDTNPECIFIDVNNKEILIDKSEFGLWEQTAAKWPGYSFKMGDYGYIGFLKLVGIDTGKLMMSSEKAQTEFEEATKHSPTFNALAFADNLLMVEKDVQFSADFFDTMSPKQTLSEKVKRFIKRFKPVK